MSLAVALFKINQCYLKTPVTGGLQRRTMHNLSEPELKRVWLFVLCVQESFFEFNMYAIAQPAATLLISGSALPALNQTHASQSPTEPTPAAPPPLITHDEQPSSAELSLKSQWTPLPLPLASPEWISFSAGLSLLGWFHVKAGPLG